MRFTASAYGQDTRPEKPKNGKAEKPKGGWRTKSGVVKLGKRASIEAETFGEAVEKVAAIVAGMPDDAQAKVSRVKIEVDTSDPKSGGNPFV